MLLGGAKSLISGGLAFIGKLSPSQLAIAALCILSAFLWWHGGRIEKQRDEARMEVIGLKTESKKAHDDQVALNNAREAQYQEQAHETDANYQAELADARSATDRYIATHRMRQGSGIGTSNPAAVAGNSTIPDSVPTNSILVSSTDVQACSASSAYAIAAHNDAIDRLAAGTAMIEKVVTSPAP
jgi:hypothetical protein